LENRTRQISATIGLRRQQNGALVMKAFNGLVVLEIRQVMSAEAHPLQHQRNPMQGASIPPAYSASDPIFGPSSITKSPINHPINHS